MVVSCNNPNYNTQRLKSFLTKIEKTSNGCWEWQGSRNKVIGYGNTHYKRKSISAHRLSYMLFYGEIPNGLVIHHRCENKICANPEHLEAVTQADNLKFAGWGGNQQKQKTTCPYGHEYSLVSEVVNGKKRQRRVCDICINYRKQKITSKLSMIEFENKLKIEEELKNQQHSFDYTDVIEQGIINFGRGSFKSAIRLKLFEQGVNTYGKTITRAIKWIEKSNISIDEIAKELNLTITKTRLRKQIYEINQLND